MSACGLEHARSQECANSRILGAAAGTVLRDAGVRGHSIHLGGPEQAIASRLHGRQLGLGGLGGGGTVPGGERHLPGVRLHPAGTAAGLCP
ncbi:hypothetical protein GCM10010446_68710 [Streptomyces enissocaesilis]|uniref:Uncharacterized protein n=1 Tax=Streptomyces enissocaesilis TaxID=332589 RepID=A0ABN3XQD0_9ACTN